MLTGRGKSLFVAQGGQGGDDFWSRLTGLNDIVNITGAGGKVRVVEALAIVVGQAFASLHPAAPQYRSVS